MVLAELGSKIQTALHKMGQATVIDDTVLDELVSPNSSQPSSLPFSLSPSLHHSLLPSFFRSFLGSSSVLRVCC